MGELTETIAASSAYEEKSAETNLLQSPFCTELRSKKYYFMQEMPTHESQILDASNHCWCRLTMQATGPDGNLAYPRGCAPGRSCYKSLFAES